VIHVRRNAWETAEILAELVNPAKSMREAQSRGEKLKVSEKEIAFYDALKVNLAIPLSRR
jgi:type I restriction enzyme R subunit